MLNITSQNPQLRALLGVNSARFEACFLTDSEPSLTAYRAGIATALDTLVEHFVTQARPYSGKSPTELATHFNSTDICPDVGQDLTKVLKQVGETILKHSVVVSHPACVAHLHCPPLTAALAAELLISATNQSMDSWDQSPAATLLEQQMVNWLCHLFGYEALADGVFTSGGTQSNFMGLLLARDHYAYHRLGWHTQKQGLPPEASRFRILCSDVSHFSVRQAASLLGLGEDAIVTVETDPHYRLSPSDLDRQLKTLHRQDLLPIALVAMAGTTDFGSIDPLPELAACAQAHRLWLHVDAAYGGALMLSDRHRHQLAGIEAADSITVDFHKLFYQPISCGAFLLKDRRHFNLFKLHVDYLNPAKHESLGMPDLVTKSVQTTRRFDALKLFVSLQTLGRQLLASMLDATIDLAADVALLIDADSMLELACQPTINAVVFRYCSNSILAERDSAIRLNQINAEIRMTLLMGGLTVLGETTIAGQIYLKFTLLNPQTSLIQIKAILGDIKRLGREFEINQANQQSQ